MPGPPQERIGRPSDVNLWIRELPYPSLTKMSPVLGETAGHAADFSECESIPGRVPERPYSVIGSPAGEMVNQTWLTPCPRVLPASLSPEKL